MKDRKRSNENWGEEFLEFAESEPVDPPLIVSEKICRRIREEMIASVRRVLAKLGLIQLLWSFATLLVCPQFELGLTAGVHTDHLLHRSFGEWGHMVVCGAIFMSGGAAISAGILRREEINALNKTRFVFFPLTCFVALSIFRFFGSPALPADYVLWFLGAIGGSLPVFEAAKRARFAYGDLMAT